MMIPPNERRNRIHRRIVRGITGLVVGGITGGVSGGLRGAARGFARPSGRTGGSPTGRARTGQQIRDARGAGACRPNQVLSPDGHCHSRSAAIQQHGQAAGLAFAAPSSAVILAPTGTAVATTGTYMPAAESVTVRRCMPGDILGKDGLCHTKGSIPNKQRAHPRGRRPLGTPGEMAALAKAASFGKRMESTVKRMQKIGVLKKPAKRSQPRQKLIGAGPLHHAPE